MNRRGQRVHWHLPHVFKCCNKDSCRMDDFRGVSVVIPTYNRKTRLLRCLSRIPREADVVVVDDGSDDGTREALESISRRSLRVVRQPNGGPAKARNRGVREAGGDVIAFIDDDCVPAEGWLQRLTRPLRERDGPAGVGGRVLPWKEGVVARYNTHHRILEPPPGLSYLVTANCAYRRRVFEEAGGFPEDIGFPGGEDPGLSRAVRQRGHRLAMEPRAVVYHEYRESVLDFARTFFRYGRGCARVMGG